jgi:hypothetical protein
LPTHLAHCECLYKPRGTVLRALRRPNCSQVGRVQEYNGVALLIFIAYRFLQTFAMYIVIGARLCASTRLRLATTLLRCSSTTFPLHVAKFSTIICAGDEEFEIPRHKLTTAFARSSGAVSTLLSAEHTCGLMQQPRHWNCREVKTLINSTRKRKCGSTWIKRTG